MSTLRSRLQIDLLTFKALLQNDIRLSSALLYPLRRHLHFDNMLTLRSGVSVTAPNEEPLLHLFREIWMESRYSLPEFSIRIESVIVDIGAHVGTFTVWAASRNPTARVIAVEPCDAMLKYLHRNVTINRLDNVSIVEAACGASEGLVQMFARGPAACNTIYPSDNYGSSFKAAGQTKMITLDRLFSSFAIERCDLLKLDCEGAEYEILYSAKKETLDRVHSIAMEYHVGMNQHRPTQLAEHLKRIGFNIDLQALLDQEGGYLFAIRS